MKNQFTILKKSRALTLKAIEGLTLEQLHKIPDGFKNNIAWNIAHLVVTQQLLHYKLSGLDCLCPDTLIENYRKGTFPTTRFSQEEFDEVLDLFKGLPETLEEDFEAGIFEQYTEYPTSTGIVLNAIEIAIPFNNYHEGIHFCFAVSV
jgi:hypothetical protein